MDTLTVKGIGRRVDGDYPCDLTALLVDVNSPDALLVSEAEVIKRLCGARGYGIAEAFLADDWTVQMAVALVILKRADVVVTEQQGWGAKVGAFTFQMDATPTVEQEDDDSADPPTEASENGGGSGSPTSAPSPVTDQPATGHLASVAS